MFVNNKTINILLPSSSPSEAADYSKTLLQYVIGRLIIYLTVSQF